ncbi:MAG: hypothetical protein ACREJB_11650, partial [Planctomycetaceae bacterium]
NLHNLFDNFLSHRLNAAATVAFPLACIVLPWLATRRKLWDKTGHWVHFLLPRKELVLLVVLAQLATWFDDVAELAGSDNYWARATELKEMYWALTSLCYVRLMRHRHVTSAACGEAPVETDDGPVLLPFPTAARAARHHRPTRRAA